MSHFHRRLSALARTHTPRRWVYVPYDQLTDEIGPLALTSPHELGIVLIESTHKPGRRPYHRQKLALLLANMRHFALEQATRGVRVRYEHSDHDYATVLRSVARETGPLDVMRPAERELRHELAPLFAEGILREVPHAGWLTTRDDFEGSQHGPPWRMDAFYRAVRRRTGLLMEGDAPIGGKYSFGPENRASWDGTPPPPAPVVFKPDDVTEEVIALVDRRFANHPGTIDRTTLPATKADAHRLWRAFLAHALEHFGPFEDAMSTRSDTLFHARVSPLMNLHRLLPRTLVEDVAAADAPLASREGFVRQVLGWREFVRHVHDATDGFRRPDVKTAAHPGDGGWATWRNAPWPATSGGDGGALPSALGAHRPLPPAFWGAPSGLACLDHVVAGVWRTGYSHHITRLMVLSNLATLLDVEPRELTDWFWVAYADAYDWVVEPNVLGMGTFAAGALMTTKPYIAGAAYIDRMSDYCGKCAFHPKKDCPITPLYWAFLARHRTTLDGNPRMLVTLKASDKRDPAKRKEDAATFERVSRTLTEGRTLAPAQGELAPRKR